MLSEYLKILECTTLDHPAIFITFCWVSKKEGFDFVSDWGISFRDNIKFGGMVVV
jgi:hypothetical protein